VREVGNRGKPANNLKANEQTVIKDEDLSLTPMGWRMLAYGTGVQDTHKKLPEKELNAAQRAPFSEIIRTSDYNPFV